MDVGRLVESAFHCMLLPCFGIIDSKLSFCVYYSLLLLQAYSAKAVKKKTRIHFINLDIRIKRTDLYYIKLRNSQKQPLKKITEETQKWLQIFIKLHQTSIRNKVCRLINGHELMIIGIRHFKGITLLIAKMHTIILIPWKFVYFSILWEQKQFHYRRD